MNGFVNADAGAAGRMAQSVRASGRAAAVAIACLLASGAPAAAQEPAADSALAAPAEAAAGKDVAVLERRVEQLEKQLVDLRTMFGTAQSLKASQGDVAAAAMPWDGGGSGATMNSGSSDDGRVDALTRQVETLSRRLARLEAGGGARSGEPGDGQSAESPGAAMTERGRSAFDRMDGMSGMGGRAGVGAEENRFSTAAPTNGFSTFSEEPPSSAPVEADPQPQAEPRRQASLERYKGMDARGLYREGYSQMLQRDYPAAEGAFMALIGKYPDSNLAGNAQYWLGETHYVRTQYRRAADAFLKSYRDYPNSVKAPDSLMKLALSLGKLGQSKAACDTFDKLEASYPNAPSHVKQRAGMEKRRAGCR